MQVLFLDSVHPILEKALTAKGYACQHDYLCTPEALLQKIESFTGIVVRSRITVDRALLEHALNLKWIARSGSGLENIDTASAKELGIQVFSSPEGNRDAVGEHVIGMLLMLLNRLHFANAEVKAMQWNREKNRGLELASLTVGIIGYGHMGSALAQKLKGFGCRIMAYDKYRKGFGSEDVQESSLEVICEKADVVSIHLPLSDETKYFVNQQFISSMKKPFFLVNTARGQHVDSTALVEGLKSGSVRGACLDVLEYEKRSLEGLDVTELPEALRYLLQSDEVVLSPHVAGWTEESYEKLSLVLAQKIDAAF